MDGIYLITFAGDFGKGQAALLLRDGTITGADILRPGVPGDGVQYDGSYVTGDGLVPFKMKLTMPRCVPAAQGHSLTTPTAIDEIHNTLPRGFSGGYLPAIDTSLGKVQVHLKKLRTL